MWGCRIEGLIVITEIFIRNMVCRHCVATVERALKGAGLDVRHVELGRADVLRPETMSDNEFFNIVDDTLHANDFERITDPGARLIEKIKHAVIKHVRDAAECRMNLSACIASRLSVSYDRASRIFSASEGRTIERFHLLQRIEYVKELLADPNLTISDIAYTAGYSSVAHLSRQFKSETGMTPGQYAAAGFPLRKSIDRL